MVNPLPLGQADPRRLGGYEVTGRLGTGGQGVVYQARPDDGGPPVAIKLLHTRLLGDRHARARFVRELALLRRVAGFCTAQILDADMDGDQPYIVSELVPGPSLRELVRDRGPRVGADLDRLAVTSVTALTAIHGAGIVHRDFKPQNVLMGPDGPRVIDFGIARALDAGSTVTSQVVGTPAYMAPEQFTGTSVGPAADLFAWAATLLYAATGRDPFAGGPLPAVMYRILHETPDLDPLPPQLAEIAAACLAKDPHSRPLAEQVLMWLLGDQGQSVRRTAPPPEAAPPVQGTAQGPLAGADDATEPVPPDGSPGPADPAYERRGTAPYTDPGSGRSAVTAGRAADPPPVPSGHLGQRPAAEPGEASDPLTRGEGRGSYALSEGTTPSWRAVPYAPGEGQVPAQGAVPVEERIPGAGDAPRSAHAPTRPGPQEAYGPEAYGAGAHGAEAYGQGPYERGPHGPGPYGQDPSMRPDASAHHAPPEGPGRARRSRALTAGLVLAGLLASFDVVGVAAVVASPDLSDGPGGRRMLLTGASLVVLAVITLVGVVLAWRGSRPAVWTVLVVRVLRVVVWGAWSLVVVVRTPDLALQAGLTVPVVLLLAWGMRVRAPAR
ncbi:protein kinase domain-containing protein [Spirillospora sp. CA-253888]